MARRRLRFQGYPIGDVGYCTRCRARHPTWRGLVTCKLCRPGSTTNPRVTGSPMFHGGAAKPECWALRLAGDRFLFSSRDDALVAAEALAAVGVRRSRMRVV